MRFISPSVMYALVKKIESDLPGYWYYIRQTQNKAGATEVQIVLGPSEYSLLDTDRAWSRTREGDNGITTMLVQPATGDLMSVEDVMTLVWGFVKDNVDAGRQKALDDGVVIPPYKRGARKHTPDDLKKFRRRYERITEEFNKFEKDYSPTISGLQIGSCHLSVDATIFVMVRGNEHRFDCDLQNHKGEIPTFVDSLDGAYSDLLDAVKMKLL